MTVRSLTRTHKNTQCDTYGRKEKAMKENSENSKEIKVPVKFNHRTYTLSLEDASVFAQKGMKYDMISEDYEKLKALAAGKKSSVPVFLAELEKEGLNSRIEELKEKCGGDEDFARHIAELELKESDFDPLGEIKKYFPSVKDISSLPAEVTERAETRGSNLLDEFLRYRAEMNLKKKQGADFFSAAENSSTGSLKEAEIDSGTASAEFIKGLWGE